MSSCGDATIARHVGITRFHQASDAKAALEEHGPSGKIGATVLVHDAEGEARRDGVEARAGGGLEGQGEECFFGLARNGGCDEARVNRRRRGVSRVLNLTRVAEHQRQPRKEHHVMIEADVEAQLKLVSGVGEVADVDEVLVGSRGSDSALTAERSGGAGAAKCDMHVEVEGVSVVRRVGHVGERKGFGEEAQVLVLSARSRR